MSKRRPHLNEPRFIRELPYEAGTYLQAFTTAKSNALKSITYKVVDYTKALLTSAPTSRESGLFSVTSDDGEAGDSETSKEALPTEDEGREDDINDSELEGGATIEKLLTSVNDKNMPALSNRRKVTLSKAF
ncbi:hypothetical protein K431DRAFT_308242 [Polychaeton citri CBS 116435]|uniref:Uncharacterized protein n=1 Tax=Polychaeton citri CBS 116435 TaxID=1314669 RepID=A0A9P4PXZ3_9PEZI|nr:hypothetical protein K431DRAFT_308242 [Polychaeton citri CBS 116435]